MRINGLQLGNYLMSKSISFIIVGSVRGIFPPRNLMDFCIGANLIFGDPQQRPPTQTRLVGYSPKAFKTISPAQLHQKGFELVVQMMGGNNSGKTPNPNDGLEPLIAKFTSCHLGGKSAVFSVGLNRKILSKKRNLMLLSPLTDQYLVVVRILASELKIAMGDGKRKLCLQIELRQNHTIHSSTDR